MQSKAGASFLVLWLVANAVGGFLTGALEGGGLQFFATILLQGPILGVAQALALWRVLPRAWAWAVVTPIVFITALMLTGPLSGAPAGRLTQLVGLWETFWLQAMMMSLVMLIVGLGQWAVFHSLSTWWMFISLLGGATLGMTGATVCLYFCAPLAATAGNWLSTGVSVGAGWLAYSLPTGLWLMGRELGAEEQG
jgi:hypothetical protein